MPTIPNIYEGASVQAMTGAAVNAINEPKEEILNAANTTNQIPMTAKPSGQCKANNTPNAVATPLPPYSDPL